MCYLQETSSLAFCTFYQRAVPDLKLLLITVGVIPAAIVQVEVFSGNHYASQSSPSSAPRSIGFIDYDPEHSCLPSQLQHYVSKPQHGFPITITTPPPGLNLRSKLCRHTIETFRALKYNAANKRFYGICSIKTRFPSPITTRRPG
jgi:hypothetical protein